MTDMTSNAKPDGNGSNPWIRTADGGKFYYLNMDGTQYNIDVAAAALSRLCRYAGHLSDEWEDDIYSVAQHSVYVYRLLKKVKADPAAYPWALAHDVPEAYFVDLPSPLKGIIPQYTNLEDASAAAFRKSFGIPHNDKIERWVKWADYQLYFAERRVLTEIPGDEMGLSPRPSFTLQEIDPQFYLWRPKYARYQFKMAYLEAMKLYQEDRYANAS